MKRQPSPTATTAAPSSLIAQRRRQAGRQLAADSDWMFAQVENGRTARQIAAELGISTGAVKSWLRRHQLTAAA